MAACDMHQGIVADVGRLRDDVGDIYGKVHAAAAQIVAINMRLDAREADMARIEASMEKTIARIEGMIQSLVTQIQTLQNARGSKMVERWDDIVKSALSYIAVLALGALAAIIIESIRKGGS